MKYIFTNGHILDGTKDMKVLDGHSVLVEDDKITGIVKGNAVPDGFKEINLEGRYLMPGLINMHVHLAGNGKPQKKQRDNEKENRTKKEAEQSEFRTAGYDMWSRMEPQNEKLMAAMQQLSLKERFVVTEYVLKGKPFKEIAQETGLKEKGVASAYYRSIKKLRAEMGDVK